MEESPAPASKKLLHLQGLRGLAIIAVTCFHFFPKYLTYGYLGVDVFFALSGYLMTMMLGKSSQLGVAEVFDFFYRRVKRIVPLYYLTTLLILVSLYFAPISLQEANLEPALASIAFITNLERPDAVGGYFEKLGLSVDMFTHTWSLSLEMQFYALFPIIFLLYHAFSNRRGNIFLVIISILSIVFYTSSDAFLSFNSVFSRIWQFNAGMFVYTLMNPHTAYKRLDEGEEEKLIGPSSAEKGDNLILYSFVILVGLVSIPQSMHGDYARILVIVITMQLLQWGEGSFLENRVLVMIGEVSYAWYLIHWPFAAQCKYMRITNPFFLFLILCLTFILSAAFHYGFERFYLRWNKAPTVATILVLFIANGASIYYLNSRLPVESRLQMNQASVSTNFTHLPNSSFNWPSDFMEWKPFYANMTNDERLNLNEGYLAGDIPRSMLETYCPRVKTNNTAENRCIFDEGLNNASDRSLLVIGNSYGSNLFPIIREECSQNFSHMEISWMGACEVFARSEGDRVWFDCTKDDFFVEAVQRVQPDVLFIIQRYFQFMEIINGTNPFDDSVFQIASERLAEIQKYVKRRIFILDDFPESGQAMNTVINKLKGNVEINDELLNKQSFQNLIVKMRLTRLLSQCPKCRLFDYTPQFYFNGSFKFYDPDYFVSFVSRARHLTPAGWERVRPLVRNLCYTQI